MIKLEVSDGAAVTKDAKFELTSPLMKNLPSTNDVNATIKVADGSIFHPGSILKIILPESICDSTGNLSSEDAQIRLQIGPNNVFHDHCNVIIDLSERSNEELMSNDSLLIINEGNVFECRCYVKCGSISSFNFFATCSRVHAGQVKSDCSISAMANYSGKVLDRQAIYRMGQNIFTRDYMIGGKRNKKDVEVYVKSMKNTLSKHHSLV